MIIKMNLDGTIDKVLGDRVFKMSNNVNKIYLIGPIAKNSNVLINFKLPDGSMQYGIMTYTGLDVTEELNMWEYKVKNNITEIPGKVELSIEVRTTNETLLTARTHITVEDALSSEIEPGDVDEFLNLATKAILNSQEALNRSYTKQEIDLKVASVKQSQVNIKQLQDFERSVLKRDGSTTMDRDYVPENDKDVVTVDWLLKQISNLVAGQPSFNYLKMRPIECLNITDVIEKDHRHNHDDRYMKIGEGITCVHLSEHELNITVNL